MSSFLNVVVRALNHPVVKPAIEQAFGCLPIAFLAIASYDMAVSAPQPARSPQPQWVRSAVKVVKILSFVSLLFSAATAPLSLTLVGVVVHLTATAPLFEKVWGPSTIFVLNRYHPRHVISIAAVILALPAVTMTTVEGATWVYRQMQHTSSLDSSSRLHTLQLRIMVMINALTSRPTLHIVNRLAHL